MTASEAILNENDNIKLDPNLITYSEKYDDGKYEYRNIILPKDFAVHIPRTHLLTETEWRNLGILQSPGWVHYCTHGPDHSNNNMTSHIQCNFSKNLMLRNVKETMFDATKRFLQRSLLLNLMKPIIEVQK